MSLLLLNILMNSVYIIYSPSIDKYYIGETEDLISRLAQHNEHTFKGSYTAKASDCGLVWSQQFENRSIYHQIYKFKRNSNFYPIEILKIMISLSRGFWTIPGGTT